MRRVGRDFGGRGAWLRRTTDAKHAEDGRLEAMADLRLPMVECRLRGTPYCGDPLEMLKMKIDPIMCMKTKDTMTKCPANYMTFTKKMHELGPD